MGSGLCLQGEMGEGCRRTAVGKVINLPQLAKRSLLSSPPVCLCSWFPCGPCTGVAREWSCWGQLPQQRRVLQSLPFHSSQTAQFIHVSISCEEGGWEHKESIITKTCFLEYPQYASFCAEHLIYCFICPHNNSHFTDEKVEPQRWRDLSKVIQMI